MFARLKKWWHRRNDTYHEAHVKQQLGFRANTSANIKNSRTEQARWKRFEIAEHIEKLKNNGFEIDESQAFYQIEDDSDYTYKANPLQNLDILEAVNNSSNQNVELLLTVSSL